MLGMSKSTIKQIGTIQVGLIKPLVKFSLALVSVLVNLLISRALEAGEAIVIVVGIVGASGADQGFIVVERCLDGTGGRSRYILFAIDLSNNC